MCAPSFGKICDGCPFCVLIWCGMTHMLFWLSIIALAISYNLTERDLDQWKHSVDSSVVLDLPPHLIIPSASIKLIETIAEGMNNIILHAIKIIIIMHLYIGEFSIVFKGYIIKFKHHDGQEAFDEYLAIKTLKGWSSQFHRYHGIYTHVYLPKNCYDRVLWPP